MRARLLQDYQWFSNLDITAILNAMQMGNVTHDQLRELEGFFFKSLSVTSYLQLLVDRSLLIDHQSIFAVNSLLELKHTICDYFQRSVDGQQHF